MQPRTGLMRQLFAVAAQRGLAVEDLRALFRVQSLKSVPDASLRNWIAQHNRPMPEGNGEQGTGNRKPARDKRAYLQKLIYWMGRDGWPQTFIDEVCKEHRVDPASKLNVAGQVSKCIAALWQARRHGWEAKGIKPMPDTRRNKSTKSTESTTSKSSAAQHRGPPSVLLALPPEAACSS